MRRTLPCLLGLMVLCVGCEQRGTIVPADDITVSTDAAGQVLYLPGNDLNATAAYAQFLQLKADARGLRETGGYYVETIRANLQQQEHLARRARAQGWIWDDLETGASIDLDAEITDIRDALKAT